MPSLTEEPGYVAARRRADHGQLGAVTLELHGRVSQQKARNTRPVVFRPRLPGAAMPHIAILGSHMAISGNRISKVIMTTRVMTKGAAPIITS